MEVGAVERVGELGEAFASARPASGSGVDGDGGGGDARTLSDRLE